MSKRIAWALLFLIFTTGAAIRLIGARENFEFGVDQYSDIRLFSVVQERIHRGQFMRIPLRGQQGTYPPDLSQNEKLVYNGGLYTYVFSILTLLVGNTPESLMWLSMGMSLLTIFMAYMAGAALFSKRVGIVSALLVAFSYEMSKYSRIFWTPTPVPLLTLTAFFAYGNILKGKQIFWPLLAFAVTAASQMHNAGYFVPFFFVIAILVQRPLLPKGRLGGLTLAAFILPVLPTLWTEFTGGFVLVRSVAHAFWTQLTLGRGPGGLGAREVLTQWVIFTRKALGEQPWGGRLEAGWSILYMLLGALFVVGIVIGIRSFLRGKQLPSSWTLLVLWGLMFFPFPWIQATYYGYFDGWDLIGLSFGVPVLLLTLAAIVDALFRHTGPRAFAAIALCLFVVLNLITAKVFLWDDEFGDLMYGQKRDVAELILHDAGDIPYDLTFLESPPNGQELLYFFVTQNKTMPQRFNGLINYWLWITLSGGPSRLHYTIVKSSLLDAEGTNTLWGEYIGGTQSLRVYKSDAAI
jgi:hypothetical protein